MNEKQRQEIKEIVHVALEEAFDSLSTSIGRGIINKLLWLGIGGLLFWAMEYIPKM